MDTLTILMQAVVVTGLLYHYVLLLAGRKPRCRVRAAPSSPWRFAVAVPAHNEEAVIADSVASMRSLIYPRALFDVHVVADHCTDATAAVAAAAGAIVHQRSCEPRGRKGYALAWLFDRLLADPKRYDAVVVFDADSRPAPDFLDVVAAELSSGARVVQGRHVIANQQSGTFAALIDADMRLNNRIHNQAKENLGLPARLMGDAMCFRREVLERYPWAAIESLTEDREYGIYLVTRQERIRFAGDAVSLGQAVTGWRDATGQRLRWYGGLYDLQRRHLTGLVTASWQQRNPAALDLALELALPSFSQLSLLAAALVVIQGLRTALFHSKAGGLSLSGVCLALAGVYPFWGLALERAPRYTFRALAFGPAYAAWRLWINLHVSAKRGKVAWVRTRRAEEISPR